MQSCNARKLTYAIMAGLLLSAGAGCGQAADSGGPPEVDQRGQALEAHLAQATKTEESLATQDSTTEAKESIVPNGDNSWELTASSGPDGTTLRVSWLAQPGEEFTLCWKKTSESGTVCSNNSDTVSTWSPNATYSSGHLFTIIPNVECDQVEYKVRVKRNFVSYRTVTVKTKPCSCADPCPQGGWYDGANCYLGTPPDGETAFVWNGYYYYTPVGADGCPVPGSWFDQVHCVFQSVPAGVNPFIWDNNFYYEACP